MPGDTIEGDALRTFAAEPIISGPIVCQLCDGVSFLYDDDFAQHQRHVAVCHLFGPGMFTSWTIFFTAENFGPWDPQLWSEESLEPFGELLEASGGYRESPRSPPHENT